MEGIDRSTLWKHKEDFVHNVFLENEQRQCFGDGGQDDCSFCILTDFVQYMEQNGYEFVKTKS